MGTVAYLRIQEARLLPHTAGKVELLAAVQIPELLDDQAQELYQVLKPFDSHMDGEHGKTDSAIQPKTFMNQPNVGTAGPWLSVGNVTSGKASAADQADECFQTLRSKQHNPLYRSKD